MAARDDRAAGRLLPVFNRLQDALALVGGDAHAPSLPQIVVVGSQSSGKSSVLESFVGRDFLPRGSGIVTRRPLILQLVHAAPGAAAVAAEGDEWGEFLHAPGQRFFDFDRIRAEIEAETERLLGASKRVSSTPIRLCIYSPHVVDLSLVDLPGITKVAVADQPADIEQQLREMVLQYISQPESIILAVSAANSDLATSDAIQLARRVDPEGRRTMGVLTKLDLMDNGTDALDALKGHVIPLARGFVGVVNRSQQDINEGKPPAAARDAERAFFASHPRYRPLASQMGTPYLARKLNELLLGHIATCLPGLQAKIGSALSEARAELASYGDARLEGRSNQGALLLQLITTFCANYREAIDGTSAVVQEAARRSGELRGGARINHIFTTAYADSLHSVDACTGLSDADISHSIRQATGPRSPLFVPEASFEVLARRQIALLRPYCLEAVEQVLGEMRALLPAALPPQVARYAALHARLQHCAHAALTRRELATAEMVNRLLDIELAYLNTSHPDFVGGGTAMRLVAQQLHAAADEQQDRAALAPPGSRAPSASPGYPPSHAEHDGGRDLSGAPARPAAQYADPLREPPPPPSGGGGAFLDQFFGMGAAKPSTPPPDPWSASPPPPPPPPPPMAAAYAPSPVGGASSREQLETHIIRSLLVSYYAIVRKNLADSVPKAIMHFLVNSVRNEIQNELVAELYKEGEFDSMLREADDAARRRADCIALVDALEQGSRIIDGMRVMDASTALDAASL